MPINSLATQVRLLQSDSVLRPVVRKYDLLRREGTLTTKDPVLAEARENAPIKLKKLKVTRPPNTYLLLISYRSTDASIASDTANAIAQSLTSTRSICALERPPRFRASWSGRWKS